MHPIVKESSEVGSPTLLVMINGAAIIVRSVAYTDAACRYAKLTKPRSIVVQQGQQGVGVAFAPVGSPLLRITDEMVINCDHVLLCHVAPDGLAKGYLQEISGLLMPGTPNRKLS